MVELKDTIEKCFDYKKDPLTANNLTSLRPYFVLKFSNTPVTNTTKFYIDFDSLLDDINMYKGLYGKNKI